MPTPNSIPLLKIAHGSPLTVENNIIYHLCGTISLILLIGFHVSDMQAGRPVRNTALARVALCWSRIFNSRQSGCMVQGEWS